MFKDLAPLWLAGDVLYVLHYYILLIMMTNRVKVVVSTDCLVLR